MCLLNLPARICCSIGAPAPGIVPARESPFLNSGNSPSTMRAPVVVVVTARRDGQTYLHGDGNGANSHSRIRRTRASPKVSVVDPCAPQSGAADRLPNHIASAAPSPGLGNEILAWKTASSWLIHGFRSVGDAICRLAWPQLRHGVRETGSALHRQPNPAASSLRDDANLPDCIGPFVVCGMRICDGLESAPSIGATLCTHRSVEPAPWRLPRPNSFLPAMHLSHGRRGGLVPIPIVIPNAIAPTRR